MDENTKDMELLNNNDVEVEIEPDVKANKGY